MKAKFLKSQLKEFVMQWRKACAMPAGEGKAYIADQFGIELEEVSQVAQQAKKLVAEFYPMLEKTAQAKGKDIPEDIASLFGDEWPSLKKPGKTRNVTTNDLLDYADSILDS